MTYQQPIFGSRPNGGFRPVSGLATAASVLIVLVLLAEALSAYTDWHVYGAAQAYDSGADPDRADLLAAVGVSSAGLVLLALTSIAAGIVFLVWLWRARINAEGFSGPDAHRRGRGWTIGGWFCPIVNWWFPFQIVADIWRASDPGRREEQPGLVMAWWFLYLAQTAVVLATFHNTLGTATPTDQQLSTAATAATVTTAVHAAAGVLIIMVIRRITQWQNQPRPDVTEYPPFPSASPTAF
jgi:hypothetical protein